MSASARPFLDRTGIRSLFSVVVTGDEVQQGKPHPDIYLRTAKKLGISPEACLVVEDALAGIAAGKAANMRVAAIPDTRFVDPRDYKRKPIMFSEACQKFRPSSVALMRPSAKSMRSDRKFPTILSS